ncbi:hypothetical protein J6590_099852 [Homalodisca vitripennis]|nr:hypothetical protein J6590_099852 [Homalodisca vitripennis]
MNVMSTFIEQMHIHPYIPDQHIEWNSIREPTQRIQYERYRVQTGSLRELITDIIRISDSTSLRVYLEQPSRMMQLFIFQQDFTSPFGEHVNEVILLARYILVYVGYFRDKLAVMILESAYVLLLPAHLTSEAVQYTAIIHEPGATAVNSRCCQTLLTTECGRCLDCQNGNKEAVSSSQQCGRCLDCQNGNKEACGRCLDCLNVNKGAVSSSQHIVGVVLIARIVTRRQQRYLLTECGGCLDCQNGNKEAVSSSLQCGRCLDCQNGNKKANGNKEAVSSSQQCGRCLDCQNGNKEACGRCLDCLNVNKRAVSSSQHIVGVVLIARIVTRRQQRYLLTECGGCLDCQNGNKEAVSSSLQCGRCLDCQNGNKKANGNKEAVSSSQQCGRCLDCQNGNKEAVSSSQQCGRCLDCQNGNKEAVSSSRQCGRCLNCQNGNKEAVSSSQHSVGVVLIARMVTREQ